MIMVALVLAGILTVAVIQKQRQAMQQLQEARVQSQQRRRQ